MAECLLDPKNNETLKQSNEYNDDSSELAPDHNIFQEKEDINSQKFQKRNKAIPSPAISPRHKTKAEIQPESPDVAVTASSTTLHSNMKTKQVKEASEKGTDEDAVAEPKTRGRKKAADTNEDDKTKQSPEDSKTNKELKRTVGKPKAIATKRPLGIRKALRSKKVITSKDKIKNVIKQGAKRGRKPGVKQTASTDKVEPPIIPASEIKTEPIEEQSPNSRSSSPKTAGRRSRLTSDVVMMKSVLSDSPNLVHGKRTSPYSMRSERGNSPSLTEGKNLRSGKPRKLKNNLLNEVVMKEQKKRRRLLSDSKASELLDGTEEKKLKRGRSFSRDSSEISKCSDVTESDISLCDALISDGDKELNKKIEKSKTEVDVENENSIQISSIVKVPSLDSKSDKTEPESTIIVNKKQRKLSLKQKTTIDSDNNNSSNRLMLETINNSLDIEDKANLLLRTDDSDTLSNARDSILTSMSKTFNTKEVSKNIRKAWRGRRFTGGTKHYASFPVKVIPSSTITNSTVSTLGDDKQETIETLSKEIDDLISNLDQSLDNENNMETENTSTVNSAIESTKSVSKYYGISKPLGDNNSILPGPETPVKDKEITSGEATPSKNDDSENIRLHFDHDVADKPIESPKEITYKCNTVASIDKLMDRLKEFEEFDKKRQRQESESKADKQLMVTNDVVLIPKSGADIKPLKDIQSVRSPEKPIEKENVLSCFENNSAISIVKKDSMRRSLDIDLPNSVTLIKRNSISRKASTGSNHSKESSDAISIFEKSLGKDVTLTEIRKPSIDKTVQPPQVDLHQLATLHPNSPNQNIAGVMIDAKQISITARIMNDKIIAPNERRKSKESISRKSSESSEIDGMAVIEKIKSPLPTVLSPSILSPVPVSIKSPEIQMMEVEPAAPPLENIIEPENVTAELTKISETMEVVEDQVPPIETPPNGVAEITETQVKIPEAKKEVKKTKTKDPQVQEAKVKDIEVKEPATVPPNEEPAKVEPERKSVDSQAGPSNLLQETPESQKKKENILRTLGLLTHKAANEAKIEKQKEKERLYGSANKKAMKASDYTGTLKTVIKLNRGSGERERKKYRSSLKITFQKSKNRSGKLSVEPGVAEDEDSYYTIERREAAASAESHRKSHYSNRLGNTETELPIEVPEPTKEATLNLVIPEKASSFSIHPGRLCLDQCFYCGGKFGLFDTPCHIAQMKSAERQKKVLDNEEKLTIDSCLCDACYRHVDRRANCPSYRKKQPNKTGPPTAKQTAPPPKDAGSPTSSSSDPTDPTDAADPTDEPTKSGVAGARCHTAGCQNAAQRAIRRKWLIKCRASVSNILQLEGDYPGLHTIPLCSTHHSALRVLLQCALCGRHTTRHRALHTAQQDYKELNILLKASSIPVEFSSQPFLCKSCRYYCMLLQEPHKNQTDFNAYKRRLLQIHNVELPPELENVTEETNIQEDNNKQKKKSKTKNKTRRSTDPEKPEENVDKADQPTEDTENTESFKDDSNDSEKIQPLEEDIESLISSNKILVPKSNDPSIHSDGSEDTQMDLDGPILPLDKQTELQYLLQKQNNPAQFMKPGANLTQKQKSIMKMQLTGILKPGQQQRIHDKNAKRIQKLGQVVIQKDKAEKKDDTEDKTVEGPNILKNLTLNEECTIETVPNRKSADITTLKNKWQMSESFTQVKKNLSELSKKLTIDKTKKAPDAKYSNPVKRLETNPSISVRELFPGEEDMNLQCNVEFNNVKGVTPEGWEKCTSTIQYDLETKKLWTELQRPYGNQSSFLRHLVLLEKYFRSGDLVLSNTATPTAINYSDSVQSRLRAYDNVVTDAPRKMEPSISLLEYRKQRPPANNKSLLKSNQNQEKVDAKKTVMPPPPVLPKPKPKEKTKKALPPELIAINTPNAQGRKAIQNVLHNIQQLVKGVSASDPTEVAAAPLPLPMPIAKADPPKEKKEAPPKEKESQPKPDTPKKQKTTSKPWRPTLMPITPENLAKIAREPRQTAVDGRSLPSLVQVMSSGKRYHITIQDYNKMCIMRREKLQQIQDVETKTKRPSTETETLITEIHPSTMLGNGGTVKQNIEKPTEAEKKENDLGNAATILKNVGLKNITIAPIPAKTATVTSQTIQTPTVSSPSLLVTSTPIKIPHLTSSVTITSETILTPTLPIAPVIASTITPMVIPKIPKSLTVIPQTFIPNLPHNITTSIATVLPSQAVLNSSIDVNKP